MSESVGEEKWNRSGKAESKRGSAHAALATQRHNAHVRFGFPYGKYSEVNGSWKDKSQRFAVIRLRQGYGATGKSDVRRQRGKAKIKRPLHAGGNAQRPTPNGERKSDVRRETSKRSLRAGGNARRPTQALVYACRSESTIQEIARHSRRRNGPRKSQAAAQLYGRSAVVESAVEWQRIISERCLDSARHDRRSCCARRLADRIGGIGVSRGWLFQPW
jgi:hypothetical protein